jgi:hypothetical protein
MEHDDYVLCEFDRKKTKRYYDGYGIKRMKMYKMACSLTSTKITKGEKN